MPLVVKRINDGEDTLEFVRTIFFPEHQDFQDIPEEIHYNIARKEFYQNIGKTGSKDLAISS